MTDEVKKPEIKLVETAPESIFDDIEALRKTATLKVSRRVVAVNVAVKKPPNNCYFRSHSAPEMSLDASILIGSEGNDDYYFVNLHAEPPRCPAPPTQGDDRGGVHVARRCDLAVAGADGRGNSRRLLEIGTRRLRDVEEGMGSTDLEQRQT